MDDAPSWSIIHFFWYKFGALGKLVLSYGTSMIRFFIQQYKV